MRPKFLYFDLGKVILDFTVEQMCRQVGEAAGIGPDRVKEAIFGSGLELEYERGAVTSREFYEAFCRETGTCAHYDVLASASADIFTLNLRLAPILAQLHQAGYRMGVLSNTCENHWTHCLARYTILRECFSVYALSYEIKECKPDAAIFHAAAELAGCRPEDIFYTDDVPGHVAGAVAAGFDAVTYTSAAQIAEELRKRGLRFNY